MSWTLVCHLITCPLASPHLVRLFLHTVADQHIQISVSFRQTFKRLSPGWSQLSSSWPPTTLYEPETLPLAASSVSWPAYAPALPPLTSHPSVPMATPSSIPTAPACCPRRHMETWRGQTRWKRERERREKERREREMTTIGILKTCRRDK